VPPPMPAAMNTRCGSPSAASTRSMCSSADLRPISGFEPAPRPRVSPRPNCTRFGVRLCERACASVLHTTKSTPSSSLVIMWFTCTTQPAYVGGHVRRSSATQTHARPIKAAQRTALPPAPPIPMTAIRGWNSENDTAVGAATTTDDDGGATAELAALAGAAWCCCVDADDAAYGCDGACLGCVDVDGLPLATGRGCAGARACCC